MCSCREKDATLCNMYLFQLLFFADLLCEIAFHIIFSNNYYYFVFIFVLYYCYTYDQLKYRYLKIFHSLHFQFYRCVFVAQYECFRVLLKRRDGPHVIDAFLDGLVQSEGLVRSRDQYHDLNERIVNTVFNIFNIYCEVLAVINRGVLNCNKLNDPSYKTSFKVNPLKKNNLIKLFDYASHSQGTHIVLHG